MKRYSMETTVGLFVVIGLICVGYMAVKLGNIPLLGKDTYPLSARFSSASGLRAGSGVEMYGIGVGTVKRLTIDPQRQMAVIEMEIKRGTKVYDDASATIKTAGLIGDKYVSIDPGGSGEALKPGGTITQTSVPADIDDLIGKYAFGDVKAGKAPKKPSK
jgi:phospholipid/cholesterol/gamma-HCH transport system substrate-binding protein